MLDSVTPEERRAWIQGLSPEDRREAIRDMALEERLAGLSPEEIAAYLKKLQAEAQPRKRKPRRKS